MSYIPKPGSMPARVIRWLQEKHPDGEKVPGSFICDELGIHPTAFVAKMEPATRAGFLIAEKLVTGSRLQWHFGFGKCPDSVPDDRIAARVIQYLEKLPPGTQVNTRDLAEAVCVQAMSIGNMRNRLKGARRAKLRIQTLVGHGLMHWWSLSAFEPIGVGDDDMDADMPPRRFAPEIQPRPGPFLPGVDVGAGARRITPVQITA